MLVTLVSVINETSPATCVVKAVAAFTVFAGFGMILRFALTSVEPEEKESKEPLANDDETVRLPDEAELTLESIRPGTSVGELLGEIDAAPREEPNPA
jgi:hypothetical protein